MNFKKPTAYYIIGKPKIKVLSAECFPHVAKLTECDKSFLTEMFSVSVKRHIFRFPDVSSHALHV